MSTIIDITLLEAIRCNANILPNEIMKIAWYLMEMGADMLCVNDEFEKFAIKAPEDIKFINLKDTFVEVELDEITIRNIEDVKQYLQDKPCKALMFNGLYKCLPWKMNEYIYEIKSNLSMPVGLCIDNTKGTATALAVEAVKAGVDYIVTCFCGRGRYRSYPALEEVIMAVNLLYDFNKPMNMKNVQKMADIYEWVSGINIPAGKPILGKDIFKCESGIHGDGILKDKQTYEPYPAEIVGKETEFVIGKHSGKAMLLKKLRSMNIDCSDKEANEILKSVKQFREEGLYVDDDLLKKIFFSLHENVSRLR
ncbi:homocitrate synthase/isopropylmalate synthase family protein [Clostridium oryzae]|uniref:2-isopropylmalate synthase n=1 Tax=Clostridium oryzae TaxID=1450648 RepID=A0A1V4IPU8_9CLOT|nr:hypothetical protein [Clostridium oryzae]OPJ61909.1 2-isopropylmalate synthase [Clostridium oryzae]